jgi:hypothetical protein
MAEVWNSLKEVRLRVRDPAGVISLEHVANAAALPITPLRQTGYRTDDSGNYQVYNTDLSAWEKRDLSISDERLNNFIDLYGLDGATVRAINAITSGLIEKLQVVKFDSGAESTQYQTLNDTIAFYRELKKAYTEEEQEVAGVSTGRIVKTCKPVIGGVYEW